MMLHLNVHVSEEAIDYVERSARIRKISCSRLMERVVKMACNEQLILSILDDDSKQPSWLPGEKTNSHFYAKHR